MSVNRDGELVTFLALEMSPPEVARRVGVSETWVYRRLKNVAFLAHLDATREQIGGLPADLRRLYAILADLRSAHHTLAVLSSKDIELTAEESRKHLDNAIRWVEEWTWLREEDLAPVELHGDTCACILGEAA